MSDKKISQLTAATTPLAGTEVLPIVQGGSTVKVANNDLRPKQIQSNATSGVLQVVGPAAASTRVMTTPDADFTVARTDAAQTFNGIQTFSDQIRTQRTTQFSGTSGAINNGQSLQIDITFSGDGFACSINFSAAGMSSLGSNFFANSILRAAKFTGGYYQGMGNTLLGNSLFSAPTLSNPSGNVIRITMANNSGADANLLNSWAISLHSNDREVSSYTVSVV